MIPSKKKLLDNSRGYTTGIARGSCLTAPISIAPTHGCWVLPLGFDGCTGDQARIKPRPCTARCREWRKPWESKSLTECVLLTKAWPCPGLQGLSPTGLAKAYSPRWGKREVAKLSWRVKVQLSDKCVWRLPTAALSSWMFTLMSLGSLRLTMNMF